MAIKLKIPRPKGNASVRRDPILRFAAVTFIVLAATFVVAFSYFYVKYDRKIEERFKGPVFANSARIFAAPRSIAVGEKADAKEIAAELRHTGYSDKDGQSSMGSYRLAGGSIQIQPGPSSYHSPEPATIRIREGQVESISGDSGNQ